MGDASGAIHTLRPVRFRYKPEFAGRNARPIRLGLIAEEVAELYPSLVSYDDAGRPETVRYDALTPLLLNEMQKQQAEIAELERLGGRALATELSSTPLGALRQTGEGRWRASLAAIYSDKSSAMFFAASRVVSWSGPRISL